MQFAPTGIDVENEEAHQLLRPIQSVALDLNKLFAMALVDLQHVATLELEDRQKELTEGCVQSERKTEKLQKEAEELHQVRV